MNINEIVLTENEIDAEYGKLSPTELITVEISASELQVLAEAMMVANKACSLATAKKMVRWENAPCEDHWKKIIPRRDCVQCQNEVKKLLEAG